MTHGRRSNDSDDLDVRSLREPPNGWAARIRALWFIVNQPGGVAILVLAFVLSVWVGWIPNPILADLSHIKAAQVSHDQVLTSAIARRVNSDATLTRLLERFDRRDALRECAELKDADLRRRCLE